MAQIPLKSIKFPGLSDTYIVPQIDDTLSVEGRAADAKAVGDEISDLKSDRYALSYVDMTTLSDGTDYDTITTVGSYKCISRASAESMIHCPTASVHILYVYQPLNNVRYVQEIHVSATTRTMVRYYNGTVWTAWETLAFSSDIPTVDDSLSNAGASADAKVTGYEIRNLKYQLSNLNCYDLLCYFSKYTNKTVENVTYTWNADKTVCTVNGTSESGTNFDVLYTNPNVVPDVIIPGETYWIRVKTTNNNLYLKVFLYYSNGETLSLNISSTRELLIPANTVGCIFRIQLANGTTANNDTISVALTKYKTNEELAKEYPLKGILADGEDIDGITDYGIYFKQSSATNATYPFNAGWLFVIPPQKRQSTNVLQIAAKYSSLFAEPRFLYRMMSGSTWLDWRPIIDVTPFQKAISDIYNYNSFDLIDYTNGTTKTFYGVTYTRNADNTWTIDGTATQISFSNILTYDNSLPDFIIPGRSYKISISNSSVAYLQLFLYFSDGTHTYINISSNDTVALPSNTTGFLLRFKVDSGRTVSNETVSVSAIAVPVLGGGGGGESVIINQEIHNDTFNNSYNISVNPTITTDANGWLLPVDSDTEDESNKTDMTSAIMAMLTTTGYCHLAPGIYYVSGNIDMPEGAMLEGCGKNTVIRLLASVTSGYILKLEKHNSVSNLMLSGSHNNISYNSFTDDKGTRHGLIFNSRYAEGTSNPEYCDVHNIFINNFTGCGIKCNNTGITVSRGLYVSQADIKWCQTGVFVDYYSEFNKFDQINTRYCYNAVENDGGNNMFIGCTLAAKNTGFLIDNSLNDKPNNSHGSVIGCTFCHIGSNSGVAIAVKNAANGFTFSNCQVWFCSILIEDSYGIAFTGMEFGSGVPIDGAAAKGATIDIKRGGAVMFTGCVFMNDLSHPPTISIEDNDLVRFTGCYGSHSGDAITAPEE